MKNSYYDVDTDDMCGIITKYSGQGISILFHLFRGLQLEQGEQCQTYRVPQPLNI